MVKKYARWSPVVVLVACIGLSGCDIDWSDVFDNDNSDDNTADVEDTDVPGLNAAVSVYAFDQAYDNLIDFLSNRNDLYRTVEVDLQERAADTDRDIRPTRVVIYDDPNVTVPIIAADPRAGLELPPAVLVYQAENDNDNDNNDNVGVAYNNRDYIAARYDVDDAQDALDVLAQDQANLAAEAAGTSITVEGETDRIDTGEGLVDRTSGNDYDTTLDRLVDAINDDNDLDLIAQIDHRVAARSIGTMLTDNDDPSTLVLFDSAGEQARLIDGGQTVAVDLPVRVLVSRETDGTVHVFYNDPDYLADRHDLDTDNAVDDLDNTLDDIVGDAID